MLGQFQWGFHPFAGKAFLACLLKLLRFATFSHFEKLSVRRIYQRFKRFSQIVPRWTNESLRYWSDDIKPSTGPGCVTFLDLGSYLSLIFFLGTSENQNLGNTQKTYISFYRQGQVSILTTKHIKTKSTYVFIKCFSIGCNVETSSKFSLPQAGRPTNCDTNIFASSLARLLLKSIILATVTSASAFQWLEQGQSKSNPVLLMVVLSK